MPTPPAPHAPPTPINPPWCSQILWVFRQKVPEISVADPIHMFLDLLDPDPDPLVRGTDPNPNPSIIKQK
jgi:hypothetical protein